MEYRHFRGLIATDASLTDPLRGYFLFRMMGRFRTGGKLEIFGSPVHQTGPAEEAWLNDG
ncbi:MAG TPA: hypothetical protein VGZ71_11855 [Puia sp.]|nr:hypothetical protein [Puia sp.]